MRVLQILMLGAMVSGAAAAGPNVVFVLADDMGWGDWRANFPEGKIATPNIDRMAAEGMRFTDAHSASAVCTPTRYGVMTGRYCWRSRLKKGVLGGWSPALIEPGRATVATFLRDQGYETACIGKWHLGMDWAAAAAEGLGDGIDPKGDPRKIDFKERARRGPDEQGFGHWFGISASLDMPPYAFIRNGRIEGELSVEKQWIRKGPATPEFEAVDVVPALQREAVAWLEKRAADAKPFFLYLPLTSPHTPVVPGKEWEGKSGMGMYGDFVMQTDAACGAVLDALDRLKLAENTLVIFTSDNGATPDNPGQRTDRAGHRSHGAWRGTKADIWEGGHRVPFVARWTGKTPAGTVCEDPICLNMLFATVGELCGVKVPEGAAPDSYSIAGHLRGEQPKAASHPYLIHHSISGMFAVRQGSWKFIEGEGSGGWSNGGKDGKGAQLYDLSRDPGEKENRVAAEPEKVAELRALLEKSRR